MADWEWMTDASRWKAYSPALSAAVEAAHQAGNSSVHLGIQSTSAPTHCITFQPQPPCQINQSTGRTRLVRREVVPSSGAAEWQWLEDESQQWHPYDAVVNSQIETAWGHCCNSNAYFQASAPAGVVVRIHHRRYTIQFESDAVQTNLVSHYSRKVRRRLAFPVVGSPTVAAVQVSVSTPQASGSQQTVSVPAPSVSGGMISLSYSKEDLEAYVETSDDNDCPICVMSLREKNAVRLAKCRHTFCKECIMRWFDNRPTCPICNMAYGLITGMQPMGTMSVQVIPAGSPEAAVGLEGFPGIDIIQIRYSFPSGIQGPEHPHPGRRFTGTRRVAYLPKTKEGEEVLNLLKTAWERRLLFRVGTSITTGQSDVVTWSGVHHKTNTWGGPTNFGYPDETYFIRVKAELAELGVR